MANAFRKAANFLGLVDDEEGAIAAPEVARSESRFNRQVRSATVEQPRPPSYLKSAPLRSAPVVSQSQSAVGQEGAVIDRIVTLHPRMYSDVRGIGEHYRLGQPVIMNLSDMEESERKRMIDFASGLVFGHYGSIERVTSKVFLLTPPNVMVSNEDKTAAAQASFFNQS
ncbi:MAG: cell division protein SepF [SAR202 cluster bacterium]|jgi:cell division inhibitor SepF|nr:cell division protein SepF [SAR202 cluster bacterium]|tara:strand:- start:3863 stop:4369 length:507 start_codon:yes stop_codon:yes gene_type:complete